MPARNTVRCYTKDGVYHVYNRGVEKRIIFIDEEDYKVFLYYLFIYLAPLNTVLDHYPKLKLTLQKNNLHEDIRLLAYALMPNHLHLLVKQDSNDGVTKLLRRLTSAYTHYFNQKYLRVGSLVQGVFKASLIGNEEYLLHVSRYIHRNPLSLKGYPTVESLKRYPWSSYPIYLRMRQSTYVDATLITTFFNENFTQLSYEAFVAESDSKDLVPSDYLIDEDSH